MPAAPRLVLLARILVAIWRGDWATFADAATAARGGGVPRGDLEETVLQAVLFCGFPRVVTAFEELAAAWPVEVAPAGGGLPAARQAEAGRALFAAIYGRNDAAVRAMLQNLHGELHDFVLEAAYGRILARPGLAPRDREAIAAAVLADQGQTRQFVAHARGARHLGATREELIAVLEQTLGADSAGHWVKLLR